MLFTDLAPPSTLSSRRSLPPSLPPPPEGDVSLLTRASLWAAAGIQLCLSHRSSHRYVAPFTLVLANAPVLNQMEGK